MKREDLLTALTEIEDEYLLSAEKRLAPAAESTRAAPPVLQRKRRLRKGLLTAAVAAAVAMALFTTALAVNTAFRETVFRLLHMEQEEIVPHRPPMQPVENGAMYTEPERVVMGGVLERTDLHAPVASHAVGGVYLACTDAVEMRQGSHYDAYAEENGAFIRLESHSFSRNYTVRGRQFAVRFDWVEHNGQVVLTWADPEGPYIFFGNAGSAESVLIQLRFAGFTCYPVLLNLYTGELTEPLAGTGAENLPNILYTALSEDRQKMLLVQYGGDLHYVDLAAKKCSAVEKLSGEHADACSLIDDTLVCWAEQDGVYRIWAIDLTDFTRREICTAPRYRECGEGIVFLRGFDTWVHSEYSTGCRFALMVDPLEQVYAVDLTTGRHFLIEGLTWLENRYADVGCIPSPDGRKVLLTGGTTGCNYEYIGVLDFEKRIYYDFERENDTEIREQMIGWLDANTVVIDTDSAEFSRDFYQYRLLEE